MSLKKFWKKNKTAIIVVLILVGVFFVVSSPFALFSISSRVESSKGYAPTMDTVGAREQYYPSPGDGSEYYPEEERKLRKTANVELEVKKENYGSAKVALESMSNKYDGYYTSKNERKVTYGDKEYRVFTISLRVPVDKFDSAVEDIKNVAQLEAVNINADDLTTQYYDIKTYLDNYKKEKEKLDQLYDRADEIEDLIAIQERLTEVQRQIDRYQAQLDNIERVTDYSTIYVTLSEEKDVIEGFYEFTSLREMWRNIVRSFDRFFVFLSNILGWIIMAGLIFGAVKLIKKVK